MQSKSTTSHADGNNHVEANASNMRRSCNCIEPCLALMMTTACSPDIGDDNRKSKALTWPDHSATSCTDRCRRQNCHSWSDRSCVPDPQSTIGDCLSHSEYGGWGYGPHRTGTADHLPGLKCQLPGTALQFHGCHGLEEVGCCNQRLGDVSVSHSNR